MKLYQVVNKSGNAASYDTINPEALFLDKDEAKAYIEFLKNECDLDVSQYRVVCIASLITTPWKRQ